MAEPRALQAYESTKEPVSSRAGDCSKPWKRRDSVSHEQTGSKLPGMFSVFWGKNKRKETEKKESRRRAKSPPSIVHVHQHWSHYPTPSTEAPEPPAAAAWLPPHTQPLYEHETRPQPASPKISVPPSYSTASRTSWNPTQPPPRLEERRPSSRRNSQRQPSDHVSMRYRQATLRPEDEAQAVPDRSPRPCYDESLPLRNSKIGRSERRQRPPSGSDPKSHQGDVEFPLREKAREKARRRAREGNRDSDVLEDEAMIDLDKESLKEQLRMANAKLAEYEARNAAMANEAEVSRTRVPAGRSRDDSGHHSMYKPPLVQSEDVALDDDYLDYNPSDEERSDDAQKSATGLSQHYHRCAHLRFEPQNERPSPDETGTMRPRSSDSYKDRSRWSQNQHRLGPLDIETAQRPATADHPSTPFNVATDPTSPMTGSQQRGSRHRASSSTTHTGMQPQKDQTPRNPSIVNQDLSASDARLGSPAELGGFEPLAASQQRTSSIEPSRASPPHRHASTRSHRRNQASGQTPRTSYLTQPCERNSKRDAADEAKSYIQQTKNRSHRVSTESSNLPSPSATSMMRTSRSSSGVRAQRTSDKGKIIKDDDPIEEPPVLNTTVGLSDSKRGGDRRDRPSSAWV